MVITSIELRDFCQHETLELDDLGRSNFLSGPIAAGKTNVLNAIRMVLTGQCADQDGNAVRPVDLIRDGSESAEVRIIFLHGDHEIDARLTIQTASPQTVLSYDVDGRPERSGSAKDLREALLTHLGLNSSYVGPAVSARDYLFDSLAQRKAGHDLGGLIAGLGRAAAPTPERIAEIAGEHDWAIKVLLSEQRLTLRCIADLKTLGDAAADARKRAAGAIETTERQIETLSAVQPPMDTAGKPIDPARRAIVEKTVTDLSRERDAVMKQMGAANAGGRAAGDISADLERTRAIEAKEEKVYAVIHEAETAARDAATRCQIVLNDLQSQRRENQTAINRHKGSEIKSNVETSETDAGTCSKCGQKINKTIREALAKQIAQERGRILREIDSLEAATTVCDRDIDAGETALKLAQSALFEAGEKSRASMAALAAVRAKRHTLESERPAGEVDMAALEAQAESLRERMLKGGAILASLDAIAKRDALTASLVELRATHAALEWIYRACLGKRGEGGELRALFGADGVETFERRCNEILAPFGSELRVTQAGPDTVLTIDGKPVSRASDGQMVLIETAVALAFAEGGVVLIDRVCDLDGQTKAAFWRMLGDNQERVGTLICAGAWSLGKDPDFDAVAAHLDPTAFYWIGDGATVVVTP